MKPVIILKRARKLIEKGWAQGASAKNAEGTAVMEFSRTAVSWCAMGAIQRAGNESWESALPSLRAAVPPGNKSVFEYNDSPRRTKKQILALFDKAIARAGG